MITQTNAFVVVLDTCVLAPMPLCDTLLRLAEDPAFYMPRWSDDILNELRRVLRRMDYSEAQVQRRIDAMGGAFEDAFVSGYEGLIPAMTNDAKDRHVLAAAIRCGAHAIVSENVKHFPPIQWRPMGSTPSPQTSFSSTNSTSERSNLKKRCADRPMSGISPSRI